MDARIVCVAMKRRCGPIEAAAACLLAAGLLLPGGSLPALEGPEPRAIPVPVDHADPAGPKGVIHAELGAPFDASRPTVFVITDAQQFYVRRGAMAKIQRETFGDGFNVVGILGRGGSPEFLAAARLADGTPDWRAAWKIFCSAQWIEDIDAVRRELLAPGRPLLLYGASGGGHLVHEYLARHGEHVSRAFTSVAVSPDLAGDLRLDSDRFQQEVVAHDAGLLPLLRQALARYSEDRATLVMTLQRQNFFVPPGKLAEARAELIRALARGDEARYAAARRDYQVEAVSGFFDSPEGIPIRVRLFELFAPSGARRSLDGDVLRPDLENQRNFARPLLDLMDAGAIPAPRVDREAAHRIGTEVLVLAGRHDHTVDYRTAIALAAIYPKGRLFLADDDHMLSRMDASEATPRLIRAFLAEGFEGAGTLAALREAEPHRWVEP